MGQTAQNISEEKSGIINTPSRMGIFRSGTTEIKKVPGTGPVFTSDKRSVVGMSEIKPTSASYNLLESIDIRRLVSILTQEAIKFGNLDSERVTEGDRKKILQALHALNPKKYPFNLPEEIVVPEKETAPVITFPTLNNTDSMITENPDLLTKPNANDSDFLQNTKTSKGVLRSGKLGKPKNVIRLAKIEVGVELAKVESEKPKEAESDLFDQLHSQVPQPVVEIITPIEETVQEPTPQEVSVNQITTLEEEGNKKMKAVGKLLEVLAKYRNEDWRNWAVPVAFGNIKEMDPHDEQRTPQNLHMEQIKSWRDSSDIQNISAFLDDINKITEASLITKYAPSYVNPNNPSSWAAVSSFIAGEIISGPESVYGLIPDARFEISSLLKYLGTIDEATDFAQPIKKYGEGKFRHYQDCISTSQKLTVHDYYEEIRKRIADADKYENK